MVEVTLAQLAALTGGKVGAGDPASVYTGVNGLKEAGISDISFYADRKFLPELRKTRAGVVLMAADPGEVPPGCAVIQCASPSLGFAAAVKCFAPVHTPFTPGIHPSAVVHPTAVVDATTVQVGPLAIIEAGVTIGRGSSIGAGCFIGEHCRIGEDCVLHARVTVYHRCVLGDRVRIHSGAVVGSDGFGYEFVGGVHCKIDQTGIVQIDADVEIGANSTVDRARFGCTHIGEGCKIDNLVMIAHNVVLGRHVVVVAQAGIAGSTRIGDYTIIAAQAGVAGHLEVAAQTIVTGGSAVTASIKSKGTYAGFPVQPIREHQKQQVFVRQLPEIVGRLRKLENP